MENIIWKDVKGYENAYQISSNGDVKSLSKLKKGYLGEAYMTQEKILRPRHTKLNSKFQDRLKVALFHQGKRVNVFIHRLVAEAFIPNPENKPQVNHIDSNALNNKLSNLEWVTASENAIHGVKFGNIKPPVPVYIKKITDEQVKEILNLKGTMSTIKISKKYGVSGSLIDGIFKGTRRSMVKL